MIKGSNLNQLIDDNAWLGSTSTIISREGKEIDSSGEQWALPYAIWENTTIDFTKIDNKKLRWSLKAYVKDRLERVSVHAGYSTYSHVFNEFLKYESQFNIFTNNDFKYPLISLVEKFIAKAREKHRLWALYRPIQWYIYCAENYPEFGFCPAFALELEGMSIPGNPKGEAVRMEDPDKGALHKSLELPLLIKALKSDNSQKLAHLQQKAALALSIALGRNPANLTYLREKDFINLTPDAEEPCFVIKMPRIKKGQLSPRDDFLEEYLEPLYAEFIIELIQKNNQINSSLEFNGKIIPNPRPLFTKLDGNKSALLSQDWENAYNMTSANITALLKRFVARHNIISPLTENLLTITARRLRYTLATGLAAEGISKRELARILDHTDTQHVLVYFEMAGKIIEHLDKAAAKELSRYLNFFKGKVIENDDDAVNGDREDKHLAFLGRRFSEIALLPYQGIQIDIDGREYIEYFPRKQSQGDVFTPKRKLYMPSEVLPLVRDVMQELDEQCKSARETAEEVCRVKGADIRFLSSFDENKKFYKKDFKELGLSPDILKPEGWLNKNSFSYSDNEKSGNPQRYTSKEGLIAFCNKNYSDFCAAPSHIDQHGDKYYLNDLLLVRHLGGAGGTYCHWIASKCTHSMLTTFLRSFPDLAKEFASSSIEVDFTSHHFRHTLNTLLDEGGLSDLLQTKWFDRSNPRDTKAYQHTSREKRALIYKMLF